MTSYNMDAVSQYTDGELEWNWVVKPGEYEACLKVIKYEVLKLFQGDVSDERS